MAESLNKEVRFGTSQHEAIVKAVLDRKEYSSGKLEDHRDRWMQADEDMVGYIPKSAADNTRISKREMQGRVDYVTLEVPYHYAVVASMHTYISSVFLARAPVYQFAARHGEGQDAVLAVEAVLDYQLQVGKHLPYLYNWFWDACKYGVGVIGEYWDEEVRRVTKIVEREKKLLGMIGTGKTEKVKQVFEEVGYQGNRLYNIRPHDFFPDPRLPLYDFQRGEFCGRQVQVGLSYLECEALYGRYFNIDVLRKTKGRKEEIEAAYASYATEAGPQTELEPASAAIDPPYGVGSYDSTPTGKDFITLLEMCIRINPKEWGLGDSEKPEKWVFTVANERLLVGCRPMGLFHDRFPYSVIETGFGSEEFIKESIIDRTRPLSDCLTWLFNTHMYNVRKAINDVRVVDPSKIVMKDLSKPEPGGVIRLKPQYYGGDVRTAIMQLQAADFTRGHMQDTQVVEQLIQRVSGVVDNVMGLVNEGGRKTATEVRSATGFSVNRVKTLAEYFSATGVGTLAERMLINTQELMSLQRKFSIAGSMLESAQKFVDVSPESLSGFYDFVPVDGTLPVDRLAQANFWKELIVQLARVPQVAMGWDLGAMIAHTMVLQGERNVNRFKVQVAPPGMAPGGMMPGNVVPIGGGSGRGGVPAGAGGAGSATPTY